MPARVRSVSAPDVRVVSQRVGWLLSRQQPLRNKPVLTYGTSTEVYERTYFPPFLHLSRVIVYSRIAYFCFG